LQYGFVRFGEFSIGASRWKVATNLGVPPSTDLSRRTRTPHPRAEVGPRGSHVVEAVGALTKSADHSAKGGERVLGRDARRGRHSRDEALESGPE
jgi:hypothetical protein